ncbi:3beta_HSD domain-containing protein [Haematococcus lacustris]|uniref:3beta_HSD domain-containing protein n=1 Tax=Haematococcus lacustris TaxID=44745 RepID=A0A699Z0E7_HAELA|nr:3beta_HSD domain-containing protein [Haematococcus lacustris]
MASGKRRALVTGGAGFLGQHLVQQLLDTAQYDVTIFDIKAPEDSKVTVVVGDLRRMDQLLAAVRGKDVVFHCAAAAPSAENAMNNTLMQAVNVDGTANIIKACQEAQVPHLVYTSSASVVFEGKPLHMVNEDQPYATKPMDFYTRTKIRGEQLVLAANGQAGLSTVALRPSGIFGEGDPIFVPTVVKQARAGKMKFVIGNGKNLMDWTYVGNVAQAHVQAAAALAGPRSSRVAGRAYFITNQDPRPFWGMMGDVCQGLGYARPSIHLPFLLILLVAALFEYVIRPLLRPIKQLNSDFTVNRILIATTTRTFSAERAHQDLGYQPRVNMSEALARTLQSFSHLQNRPQEAADGKAA